MAVTAPTIETERLRLRAFDESDAAAVQFYADPDVMRFIPGGARDRASLESRFGAQVAAARELWSRDGFGMWAVELKNFGKVIGHCGLQHLPGSQDIEVTVLCEEPRPAYDRVHLSEFFAGAKIAIPPRRGPSPCRAPRGCRSPPAKLGAF